MADPLSRYCESRLSRVGTSLHLRLRRTDSFILFPLIHRLSSTIATSTKLPTPNSASIVTSTETRLQKTSARPRVSFLSLLSFLHPPHPYCAHTFYTLLHETHFYFYIFPRSRTSFLACFSSQRPSSLLVSSLASSRLSFSCLLTIIFTTRDFLPFKHTHTPSFAPFLHDFSSL